MYFSIAYDMHGGFFYGNVAAGRFGTVSYLNMDDHRQLTCFGDGMGGCVVVMLCICDHGCTILATFGSPDGSRETSDAELM